MLIVFGLIISQLFSQVLYKIIMFFVFAFIFNKSKNRVNVIILGLLMVVCYFSHHYCPTLLNKKAKIVAVNDKTYTIRGLMFKGLIPISESYTVGDFIEFSARRTKKFEPNFMRNLGYLENVDINKVVRIPSLKRYIYENFPYQYSKIFKYESENILSSLNYKMIGFFLLYKVLMKRFYGREYGSLAVLFYLGLLFGINFMWFRYLMKQLKIPIKIQICLSIIFFPNAVFSIPFIFSYTLYLLDIFDLQGSKGISRYCFYAQLSLYYFYEWNPIRSIFFRKIRLIVGVYTAVALLTMICPMGTEILQGIDWLIMCLYENSLLDNVSFRGSLPLVFLIFNLFLKSKRDHVLVLAASLIWICFPPCGRISYIDVGQGDSTLISLPFNKAHYLIDTGRYFAYDNVAKQLKKNGVKHLNYLILTHDDLDHVENQDRIIKDFKVKNVVNKKTQNTGVLDVVLKDKVYEESNANSIMTKLKLHGQTYLFLGDAGKEQEKELVKHRLVEDVNILKLGHHGSDTSSSKELLQSKKIHLAVASSNPKIYNHPHPRVRRRLYNEQIPLLETGEQGTIEIISFPFIQYLKTSKSSFAIIAVGD